MERETFVAELKRLRITLRKFSEITGVRRSTAYAYASGARRIPPWMPFMLKGLKLYLKDNRHV